MAKQSNQFRRNAFSPVPAMSVPAVQRTDEMIAKDKAKTRRILKGHSLIQANIVQSKMGSAGIPTVAELTARKASKNDVPTVAEYNARKYAARGK